MNQMYDELIKAVKENKSKQEIAKLKTKLCAKYKIREMPTDIQILLHSKEKLDLVTKPTRTMSGVAIVAVMTKPTKCPHGKCTMCPGGPDSKIGDVPQSYTGKEPATMRGIRNKYDPYKQVMNRLEHYIVMGQNPEKVELIIMGGTFPSFNKKYQENFVTNCFKAMNDFSDLFYKNGKFDFKKFKEFYELPGDINDKKRAKNIENKLKKLKKKTSLEKEQEKNWKRSKIKCVGLTIETRPDYGKLDQGNELLRLGCTRVEIGVQSVKDEVLKNIKRGHTTKDTVDSIQQLKDLGFKINAHYMIGLPGETNDLKGLKELFSNSDYKPDMLKIYPCMIMKGTKLYNQWKKGKYRPLTTEEAAEIIAEFKKTVPKYVRIMRVQRDIPTYMTEAGVNKTNLRQYIHEILKQKNIRCKCIRCREIGRAKKIGTPEIEVFHYKASEGHEFFIQAVDEYDNIYGFCRLRFPSEFLRKEITEQSALIRELHVYGTATGIGKKGAQHKGIGKKLMIEAEKIAATYRKEKIIVISGIGVREYYAKLGYKKEGPYMTKSF